MNRLLIVVIVVLLVVVARWILNGVIVGVVILAGVDYSCYCCYCCYCRLLLLLLLVAVVIVVVAVVWYGARVHPQVTGLHAFISMGISQ